MGLFSKYPCVFCGKQVGFIKGKKIKNGDHICNDCEKNFSAFLEASKFDKEFLTEHMEYMKKQDILYKKEVEPLGKDKIYRIVRSFNGIAFIDSIGMFEVISPKTDKKNYKELFRYDQIKDFRYYTVPNSDPNGKKYAESGLEIDMKCCYDKDGFKMQNEVKGGHPYVAQFRIPFEKDTDDASSASLAKNHLNELFGRPSETLAGSIKEKFTGSGQERAQIKAGADSLRALGKMAKAAIQKDDDAMANAKDNLKDAAKDTLTATMDYGLKYSEIADAAEKRAWN